ncbi:MAG: polyprenyl synthetase family protein [Rhabdochlamydiaceae bacterium]
MAVAQQNLKKGQSLFFHYRDLIEQEIAKNISSLGPKNKLRDACEYALTNGGKRFRPLIVLLVAEGLGSSLNVTQAALSVEFFHTASLIADDLPCMDNENERRSSPTVHKVYGETVALLASYALITEGFHKIHENVDVLKKSDHPQSFLADQIGCLALEIASRCAGIKGATGGQFSDMFPSHKTLDVLKNVIYQKTVTLFEVAFSFGWLFGGGDLEKLSLVKEVAYHLGFAFQIADDLGDMVQDEQKENCVNIGLFLGREKAFDFFLHEMKSFKACLEELNILTPSFLKMSEVLSSLALNNLRNF